MTVNGNITTTAGKPGRKYTSAASAMSETVDKVSTGCANQAGGKPSDKFARYYVVTAGFLYTAEAIHSSS